MTNEPLGEIAIPVGQYESNGQTKKRFRNIGTLMETTEDDGSKRQWMRMNLDVFHASLYALAAPFRRKGDDSVIVTVFPPKEKKPDEKPAEQEEESPY